MSNWNFRSTIAVALLSAFLMSSTGCLKTQDEVDKERAQENKESGKISTSVVQIDGSSTVEPISKAIAEEFEKVNKSVKVTIGVSGTGGGFKKFVVGETDINDASRPIKQKEIDQCKENNIEYLELKVAIDGLSVVVSKENDFCNALTVAQLKKIWEPGSKVTKWSDVDPSWPEENINLFGPDTDSGTFDYFTEAIVGESKASRDDYTANTQDNILVKGIANDKYALGYFGYSYYANNEDQLKAVGVAPEGKSVAEAVLPTKENVESGKYVPLSRPLFIYVNKKSLKKQHVKDFVTFYLNDGQQYVEEENFIKLKPEDLKESLTKLKEATGS